MHKSSCEATLRRCKTASWALEQAVVIATQPFRTAKHVSGSLKALHHASKAATFCENVCKDMIETVCSRAPILCDLLALGTVYPEEHEQLNQALHASLRLALEAVDAASSALYGFLTSNFLMRLMHAQSTKVVIEEQRAYLRSRFDDIQAHVQYATYLQGSVPQELVRETVPAVEELRRELEGLRSLTPTNKHEVKSLAVAMMERRKASGQHIHVLESVSSVDISPDGEYFIVGGQGSNVNAAIYNARTGNRITPLKGHTRFVTSVAWSPDGKRCATGSHDKSAVIWDVDTGIREITLEFHAKCVNAVAWSPDSQKVATASNDKRCILWMVSSGSRIHVLEGHSSWINSVSWSCNGRLIATGSEDHTAALWNAEDGQRLRVLQGHSKWIRTVDWSPDSAMVATASGDDTAALWVAESGVRIRVLGGHSNWVSCASWSPDGRFIATSSDDDTTAVWSAATGQLLHLCRGRNTLVKSVAWSPCGQLVYTASHDGAVRIYCVQTYL